MKSLLLALFIGLGWALSAQQILSVSPEFVDNTTEFSSLQAAVDVAADGSFIYVFPGAYNEDVLVENKSLFLVGPGYRVHENYGEVPASGNATIQNLEITGTGTVIAEGLHCKSMTVRETNGTQIRGCWLERLFIEGSTINFSRIYLSGRTWYASQNGSVFENQIRISGNNNVIFKNSVFPDSYNSTGREALLYAYTVEFYGGVTASGSVQFDRCFFRNQLLFNNRIQATITNCITYTQYGTWSSPLSGSTFSNSILNYAGTDGINDHNVDLDDVFIGYPSNPDNHSFDKRYQLKPNSPARGFATDGGDCGPYGGSNPYVPSGLPSIPLIYGFDAEETGTTGGGLPVNVKVRTQN